MQSLLDIEQKAPYSQEAEIGVLGAMLLDQEAISQAVEALGAACFYYEAHRKLFGAIVTLYEKSIEIDPVTLADQLEKDSSLEEVGGRDYILEIFSSVPTAANIAHHARIVREKYMLRRLMASCTEIIREASQPVEDTDRLIDTAEEKIFQIQDFRLKESFSQLKPLIRDSIDELEQRQKHGTTMTGVPSGFLDLDQLTGGFQQSDLVIIAGRPSMGKTSFCLNVALSLAVGENPTAVALFSLEMSKKQLTQRFLCLYGKVNLNKLRTARLTDLEWTKLHQAANALYEVPIFIDDTPEISPLELRAKARRLKKSDNIGLIMIDYMQLMRGVGKPENRTQEISQISRSLKSLAKELDIPVLALSQLNRAVEGRQDRRPQLADLRESGAIEQDADLVLFIYRPEVYGITNVEGRNVEGIAEIILEKHRNGLLFTKEYTQFENLSIRQEL